MITLIKNDFKEAKKIFDGFSGELDKQQQDNLEEIFRVIGIKIDACMNNHPEITSLNRTIAYEEDKQSGWDYDDAIQRDNKFDNAGITCIQLAETLGYGTMMMGVPYSHLSGDLKAYGFSLLYILFYKKPGGHYCCRPDNK